MAALDAWLEVDGQRYRLLRCTYGVAQATDERGRVAEKVRYQPVEVLLDVPDGEQLLAWAHDRTKRLPATLLFADADGGRTLESVQMSGAYCVSYREDFVLGDAHHGAYRCQLTLADPGGFTVRAGGPGTAYVAPAPGVHGAPSSSQPVNRNSTPFQTAYRKNINDPVRDVLGPGKLSHPEEWESTLTSLKQSGVEVMLSSEERLAYAPGTMPGRPGQIHLNENASIGALRHEYQHFLDDQQAGFLGTRGLYDLTFRKQTEQRAYNLEIKMMEEMNEQEAAAQLRQNLADELTKLDADLGDIEID